MTPLSPGNLVVCLGRVVDPIATAAISEIHQQPLGENLRFVMTNWLAEDQICEAVVLWIVDASAELPEILTFLRFGVPLLVPEECHDLKQLCVSGNCGLFFQNTDEALACLTYLIRNPLVRKSLGENAKNFANGFISQPVR